MRIDAHPLVVAAALGLLGPAALADDEAPTGIVGEWSREGVAQSPVAMGSRIELFPVENTFVLDDGVGGLNGSWTQGGDQAAEQRLSVGELVVTRHFEADGDALAVRTEVVGPEGQAEAFVEHYTRLS